MLPQPAAQSSADNDPAPSSGCAAEHGGLSISDAGAWRQSSPMSWSAGDYTICAVRIRGDIRYELWRAKEFVTRADTAAKLREVAARRDGI
jgi:hypothetical protein